MPQPTIPESRALRTFVPINAFLLFRGTQLIEGLNGSGLIAKGACLVIGIAGALAIAELWRVAFERIPGLHSKNARAWAAIASIAALTIIVTASALVTAMAIAGGEALCLSIDLGTTEIESTANARIEAAAQLGGLRTELGVVLYRYQGETETEKSKGTRTGDGGGGAVASALENVAGELRQLDQSLAKRAQEVDAAVPLIHAKLAEMRETANTAPSPSDRLKAVRRLANELRGPLARVDIRPDAASVNHVLSELESSFDENSFALSRNPAIAARQRTAIANLKTEVVRSTARLAKFAADLGATAPPDIPEFQSLTASRALLDHWPQFISPFGLSMLIDLWPGFLLAFAMIARSEKSPQQLADEELAAMPAGVLARAFSAIALLKGNRLTEKELLEIARALHGRGL
jgi:hypothetical protein